MTGGPAPAVPPVAWPLRTARLAIRPATPDDVEATYRIRSRPEVSQWLGTDASDPASYAASFGDPDRLARTLVVELAGEVGADGTRAPDGPVVGDLMLRVRDGWAQADVRDAARACEAELGWVLDPAYAGRGLATEAVAALVDACFGTLGLRRVVAECFAENTASWRLMERLGMRREHHGVRDSYHRDLGWRDSLTYALLAEEWRGGRER